MPFMQADQLWIMALAAAAAVTAAVAWWTLRPSRARPATPMPTDWAISPRPVFSTEERLVYQQLREALPHHVVLAKLPLVRFCQPDEPERVRYWYDLLGGIHVAFAICGANGRVLAAIDLTQDARSASPARITQIKQAVLSACRVRYLRCPVDHLPSIPELQMLVPQNAATVRAPQAPPSFQQAGVTLATAVASRRRERSALWQDSGVFNDSFFAPDQRSASGDSVLGALEALPSHRDTRRAGGLGRDILSDRPATPVAKRPGAPGSGEPPEASRSPRPDRPPDPRH